MESTTRLTQHFISIAPLRKGEIKHYQVTFRASFKHTDRSRASLISYLEDLGKGKQRERKPPGVVNIEPLAEPRSNCPIIQLNDASAKC